MSLEIKQLNLYQDDRILLEQVNLSVQAGQTICLFGPSGCGKTTLLNAIAGFHASYSGNIYLNEKDMHVMRPAKAFKIGYVFQDIALFPHLSIKDNIAYAFTSRQPKAVRKQRVEQLLALVELPGVEHKYPHELSGGQQQRIAIARALALEPEVLLLDEPFAHLDSDCTGCITRDMRDLILSQNIPALLVTHHLQEAEEFTDTIYTIANHKLVRYEEPKPLSAC